MPLSATLDCSRTWLLRSAAIRKLQLYFSILDGKVPPFSMVQYYTDSKSWRTKLWFTVIYCIKPTILKPFPPYCPLFCAAQGISWTEDRLLEPIPSLQQLATVEGGRGVQTLLSLCFTNTVKERAILLKQNRHFFLSGTSEDDATFQWAKQGNKQHTSRKSHLCEKFGSKKKPAVQLEEVYTWYSYFCNIQYGYFKLCNYCKHDKTCHCKTSTPPKPWR